MKNEKCHLNTVQNQTLGDVDDYIFSDTEYSVSER